MAGHVFTALRADVLEGDGCCGGKLGLLEAVHEELEYRVWKEANMTGYSTCDGLEGGKHDRLLYL